MERPSARGQHRPDHRAGHRDRRHRAGDQPDHDARDGDRPADQEEPAARHEEADHEDDDTGHDHDDRTRHPSLDRLRRSLLEPALTDGVVLQALVERRHVLAELGQQIGLDVPVAAERPETAQHVLLGRGDRASGVPGPVCLGHRVRIGYVGLDAEGGQAEHPRLLAEREQPAAGEVEQRGRQRATRSAALADQCARRRREVRRRCRKVDRRRVQIGRITSVPPPRRDRPAREQQERHGRPDQADDGVQLARRLEPGGVFRGGVGIDPRQRRREGAVQIPRPEQRQHLVLEDGLPLLVRQERRPIPGSGVQLDLPVDERWIEIEQDDQAVVEALATHAPLVHERPGVPLRLLLRHAGVDDLAVDDDLRAGAVLDGVDRGLRRADRLRAEHPGVVVDRLILDRVGKRRAAGHVRCSGGSRCAEHGGDGEQRDDRRRPGPRSHRRAGHRRPPLALGGSVEAVPIR